jgi:hypothetical protein
MSVLKSEIFQNHAKILFFFQSFNIQYTTIFNIQYTIYVQELFCAKTDSIAEDKRVQMRQNCAHACQKFILSYNWILQMQIKFFSVW